MKIKELIVEFVTVFREFPKLVSYERFVILMPTVLGSLSAYLKSLYGRCHSISFIDSTALSVCDNHRIHNFGKLIADRGYISQASFEQLLDTLGVQLITKLRMNMENHLMALPSAEETIFELVPGRFALSLNIIHVKTIPFDVSNPCILVIGEMMFLIQLYKNKNNLTIIHHVVFIWWSRQNRVRDA